MRVVVLGGAGAMGQIAVRDLAISSPVTEVVIADVDIDRAERLRQQLGSHKVSTALADINNHDLLVRVFTGAKVVINSTPYHLNLKVMEAALGANSNYLDLGGLFHTTRKQLELDERFKKKKLLCVPGMGAAPGVTNVMAAHAVKQLDTVESIDIVAGSVDFTKIDHPFLPPYALDTILDEYALEPMVFEEGAFKAKPCLSGECLIDMPQPVGKITAFLTLHSEVATLPLTYKDKGISQVTYRLGLPSEFHEKTKFLVELGFASPVELSVDTASIKPRKLLATMIAQHKVVETVPNDCEVLRVDVRGLRSGREVMIRMESIVNSHSEWKISCGALDTGVPPSIVAQMIGQGVIECHGVVAPEVAVPSELLFAELAKRSIPMRMTINEELTQLQNTKAVAV